jgi:hypothetical protein
MNTKDLDISGKDVMAKRESNTSLTHNERTLTFFKDLFQKKCNRLDLHKKHSGELPCALSPCPGSVSVTVSLTVMGRSKSIICRICDCQWSIYTCCTGLYYI